MNSYSRKQYKQEYELLFGLLKELHIPQKAKSHKEMVKAIEDFLQSHHLYDRFWHLTEGNSQKGSGHLQSAVMNQLITELQSFHPKTTERGEYQDLVAMIEKHPSHRQPELVKFIKDHPEAMQYDRICGPLTLQEIKYKKGEYTRSEEKFIGVGPDQFDQLSKDLQIDDPNYRASLIVKNWESFHDEDSNPRKKKKGKKRGKGKKR